MSGKALGGHDGGHSIGMEVEEKGRRKERGNGQTMKALIIVSNRGTRDITINIKLCNSCLIEKSPDTTQHAFNGPQSTKPVSGSKESETANQIFKASMAS